MRKITRKKNKKGQLENPIIVFVIVVLALIFLAPIMLKIVGDILDPFASGVGNVSAEAGSEVTGIKTTYINFWDFVIIMAYLVNVILLFVTAFLVDTNPVFLVLFILFGIFLFIFAPEILESVDKIYDSPDFASEVSNLQMVDFIRSNFMLMILGIYFICGVIMYAKYKLFNQPY